MRLRRPHKRTLGGLARQAGFTPASLAALTGINISTLSRHWRTKNWVAHMQGENILKIAACVPELGEALVEDALVTRLDAARAEIEQAGSKLDEEAITAALDGGIVPQYLCTGIAAAGKLLIGDAPGAEAVLRSCWGREQTRALDVAFGTHQRWCALQDPQPLIEASRSAYEVLAQAPKLSHQQCIALTHLTHHIGKATGEIVARPPTGRGASTEWLAGFYIRGAYMGRLRHPGATVEIADEYHEIVQRFENAHAVERWAFPTWVGDLLPEEDFAMPEEVRLTRTAQEILHEITNYNPVYIYYLAKTFIPVALEEMDSTFGGKRELLASALQTRAAATDETAIAEQLQKTSELVAKEAS